ncbi:MAG: acyl-CoA thioesterase [Deltaproteobacteria bacterium]|nr:acyl-CoA thioesterase [Deltaproteobacteria bacterium]
MNRTAAEPSFSHRAIVRFQDCDPAGVVFFARVFEFFHDAYAAFLTKAGLPLSRLLDEKVFMTPIVHAEADYHSPLRCGDEIQTTLCAITLGRSSMTIRYQIEKLSPKAPAPERCATGTTVHVFVDGTSFAKIPIPPDARAALEPHIDAEAN